MVLFTSFPQSGRNTEDTWSVLLPFSQTKALP
jgi:hypothetical protein